MWELEHKESWVPKNWCFWTVMLEKTLESPLDCKEIKPFNPKGNQSWIFILKTDAEGETLVFWPPEQRTDSFEKTLMLGKIEGRRRRGCWRMRRLDGITNLMNMSLSRFRELVMDREAWHAAVHGGHKESDTTERLNWKKQTFKLWCWRRLLRVPWTARRWNQSILKEINPEYSLEGLMLKLKLQSFDHLMWRADSLEKTLKLGKIDGRRRRGIQKMRWFDGLMTSLMQWTWIWANSRRWWRTGNPGICSPWGHIELDRTEGLNNNNNNNKKKNKWGTQKGLCAQEPYRVLLGINGRVAFSCLLWS